MRVFWVGLRSLCYERKGHDHPLLITSAGPHLGSLSSRALVSAGCCGKLLPCLGLWGEPGLQTPAWIFFVTVYPSFSLPPLWSFFPNPLGLHKCATLFLKKAPFFSLIIKLPRNNGCHLKQQQQSSCHLQLHIKTAGSSQEKLSLRSALPLIVSQPEGTVAWPLWELKLTSNFAPGGGRWAPQVIRS